MRVLATLAAVAFLAGCLGDEPVAPAATGGAANNTTTREPDVGICVIGVDSPCNAPQWRTPSPSPLPPPPPPTIQVAPHPVDPGVEVEVSAAWEVEGATFVWSFGDGATASGASVRHAWNEGGLYPITVTALAPSGLSAQATSVLGVRVAAAFAGTLAAGSGIVCLQDGTDCAEHVLTLPAGLTNLTGSVAPDGALPPSCNLVLYDPQGQSAASGQDVAVEFPAAGDWTLSVACQGLNVAYQIQALGTFVDDFA